MTDVMGKHGRIVHQHAVWNQARRSSKLHVFHLQHGQSERNDWGVKGKTRPVPTVPNMPPLRNMTGMMASCVLTWADDLSSGVGDDSCMSHGRPCHTRKSEHCRPLSLWPLGQVQRQSPARLARPDMIGVVEQKGVTCSGGRPGASRKVIRGPLSSRHAIEIAVSHLFR